MTIRLRPSVAARLAVAARNCGLSHGAYLTTLIDSKPAPLLTTTTELGLSTEQLAFVSGDLNELVRVVRRGGVSSGPLLDDWLKPLLADVRRHVFIASRLVAELRPARASSSHRSDEAAASEDVCS